MNLDVPVGKSGSWEIARRVVDGDEELRRLQSMMSFTYAYGGRFIPNGTYTVLYRDGGVVMSDTPAELRDHSDLARAAQRFGGHALINGLGLGCAVELIVEHVEKITVVELSEDVIRLSGTHYLRKYPDKIEIIHADAYQYKPPKEARYTVVWHDIWDTLSADNLWDMGRLHRKYARKCLWQDSWGRTLAKRSRNW